MWHYAIVLLIALLAYYFWGVVGALSVAFLGTLLVLELNNKGLRKYRFNSDYYEALFSVLGKMAIADGILDKEEEQHIENFIENTLRLTDREREQVMHYFYEAQKDSAPPLEKYLKKLIDKSHGDMVVHNSFMALVVALSIVDGRLSATEETILTRLEWYLTLPNGTVEKLLNQYGYSLQEQPDADMSSYYEILGLSADATLDEVLNAYEEKSATIASEEESHAILSRDLQKFSHGEYNKVRGAYESIKRSRLN